MALNAVSKLMGISNAAVDPATRDIVEERNRRMPYANSATLLMGINNDAVGSGDSGFVNGVSWEQQQANEAAAAEANRIAGLRRTSDASQTNYYGGAQGQFNNLGDTYSRDTRDFGTNYANQIDTANQGYANNALNLRRGMQSIAGNIRQGIRSGGVSLANMNALDSGAAEAMARAFARQGNQQYGDVNNQAALERAQIDTTVNNLNRTKEDKLEDFGVFRNSQVNSIGEGLLQNLRALDVGNQNQGLNGAVDFARRDTMINEAVNRLNQIDAALRERLSGVRTLSPEEARARAAQMDAAGAEGANPFQVDPTAGLQYAGGGNGAPVSQLPIYTRRRDER